MDNTQQPHSGIYLISLFFKMIYLMLAELWKPLSVALLFMMYAFAPYIAILLIAGAISIILLICTLILRVRFILKQLKEPSIFLAIVPSDITLQSHFSTEQLFTTLYKITQPSSWIDNNIGNKKSMSFELVSTKHDGIRYVIKTSISNAALIKKSLRSYLPYVDIREIDDYLPESEKEMGKGKWWQIVELKLSKHFAVPLVTQANYQDYDPIAYITGNMTQLSQKDLISMQLVITPVYSNTHPRYWDDIGVIISAYKQGKDISPLLNRSRNLLKQAFKALVLFIPKLFLFLMMLPLQILVYLFSSDKRVDPLPLRIFELTADPKRTHKELSPTEQEFQRTVGTKVMSNLYEVSLRFLVVGDTSQEIDDRTRGFISSLAPFENMNQRLLTRSSRIISLLNHVPWFSKKYFGLKYLFFKHRLLSLFQNPLFSVAEIASLYHFPYTLTTKTEDMVKIKTPDLPAPLSLKKDDGSLDIVFAKNTYAGREIPIGLSLAERKRHVYMIGKTDMGKSTTVEQMVYQDIVNGKAVCVIDAHGDLVKGLLGKIPSKRKQDVIYFDPLDKEYPIGLNILNPATKFDSDIEEDHEWITSSLMSIFMKLTPKDLWGPRLEHILRNATLTALQTPSPTLFTIQQLLTVRSFQREIAAKLTDPILKQFWEKEFKLFGSMQQASVISPLTHRIGKFVTSIMSRHIVLQKKSTLSIDKVMDEGKILLCNLSKGNLGEERSQFFGGLITSLIQLAAFRRAAMPESERKDFFLYIDEFQNFATPAFVDILSEARKYHLYGTYSHQSTEQIDEKLLKLILANVGNYISFRTGPDDEETLLPYFEPEVSKGMFLNLSPHHFFIKVSNEFSESAYTGETMPLDVPYNKTVADWIIENTRKQYSIARAEVEREIQQLFGGQAKTTPPSQESQDKPNTTKEKPLKKGKTNVKDEGMD
jgi:hypothetical protein